MKNSIKKSTASSFVNFQNQLSKKQMTCLMGGETPIVLPTDVICITKIVLPTDVICIK